MCLIQIQRLADYLYQTDVISAIYIGRPAGGVF